MHFVRPGLIQVISTNATLLLGSWVWTPIPSQTHWMWIWSGQSGLDWLDGTVTVTMHSFIRIRIRTCLSHACRISHIEFEIWLEAAGDVDDDGPGFQFFCAVCASTTAAARLGNFQSECAHRQNQSLLATRHLGVAKDWTTMAAESFLQTVEAAHEELMMMRRPGSLLYKTISDLIRQTDRQTIHFIWYWNLIWFALFFFFSIQHTTAYSIQFTMHCSPSNSPPVLFCTVSAAVATQQSATSSNQQSLTKTVDSGYWISLS